MDMTDRLTWIVAPTGRCSKAAMASAWRASTKARADQKGFLRLSVSKRRMYLLEKKVNNYTNVFLDANLCDNLDGRPLRP